jgi:hypothetical protein
MCGAYKVIAVSALCFLTYILYDKFEEKSKFKRKENWA